MSMLAPDAPTDERGYPKPLSRVELAKLVDEGWGKVPPFVLIRSAIKYGVARVEDYPMAIRQTANLSEVYIDPIIRDLVQRDAPVTDWRAMQTDIVNEEASLKELGSLFDLDYEIEEDRADLEDVQSSNEALHLARLADAEDGEMDIDFGTTYNEGAIDEESEQMEAAVEEAAVEVEEEVARCTKKRRKYSQKQLEFLERECFCGTMSNTEIAAAITGLDGAREVTAQDVLAWRGNAKQARKSAV